MRRELSVDEIHRAKDFIKGNGDQLITNFFVADAELDKIIKRNQLKYSFSDKTLIAVRKSDGFSRLYFFTVDADDFIINLRSLLPTIERPIAFELFVDRRNADQVEDVQRNLIELGFRHHATQTRLTKIVSTNEYGEIESEWYARADDCDEIMEILLQDFDPLCDQVPERDELLDRIANKEVLVARNGDRIASVIMFKRGAAVADWIFWVTRPEERKTFLGSMLREKYLELTGKVRRQITYTRKPNMKLFHTQVGGMQPDGFENRILVLEK